MRVIEIEKREKGIKSPRINAILTQMRKEKMTEEDRENCGVYTDPKEDCLISWKWYTDEKGNPVKDIDEASWFFYKRIRKRKERLIPDNLIPYYELEFFEPAINLQELNIVELTRVDLPDDGKPVIYNRVKCIGKNREKINCLDAKDLERLVCYLDIRDNVFSKEHYESRKWPSIPSPNVCIPFVLEKDFNAETTIKFLRFFYEIVPSTSALIRMENKENGRLYSSGSYIDLIKDYWDGSLRADCKMELTASCFNPKLVDRYIRRFIENHFSLESFEWRKFSQL